MYILIKNSVLVMNAILIVPSAAYTDKVLSSMLFISAIFPGSGADFKKACGAEMKKSCIKQLFSFINHAV
ncbi:hypothetical protein GG619_14345 [Bacillus velezensis]|uniref:hypothetical protein n=1 Tax=Bacillus TaxID=1386 RepID=UPI0012E22012|nr:MULTISPECIES: hypothetical protein [Bacillus]QGU48548.1 hypothetical protein GG619_14345 [Bacillus velezensis]UJL67632.1 hypothetical protein HSX12_14410 [Bacillus velezensis]